MQIIYTIPDADVDDASAQFESRTPRDMGDPGDPGDPNAKPPVPSRASVPAEATVDHVERAVTEWLDGELGAAYKQGIRRKLKEERGKSSPDPEKIKSHLYDLDQVEQS